MIWWYLLGAIAGILAVLSLVGLVLRPSTKEEDADIRGATMSDVTGLEDQKLVMLALCQMMETQGIDADLANELRYRATGKRNLPDKERTSP